MNKATKIFISICFLLIAASIAGYLIAKASDPYKFTEKMILNSSVIKDRLGEIKSIKLAPFGYSVMYSGSKGNADFEIEISGSRNNGVLFVVLERNVGIWEISDAALDGKRIQLRLANES